MKSQAKILEAFSLGKFPGSVSGKPKHIVTVISNVFISGDRVFKIYKNDNENFNKSFYDNSTRKNRFDFTRKDFSWNHSLNHEIYLELLGVTLNNNSLVFTDPSDKSDELCIMMKKIDIQKALVIHLINGRLDLDDFYQIGHQFADRTKSLLKTLDVKISLYQDLLIRIKDVDEFMRWVKEKIPVKEAEVYLNYLRNFVEDHKKKLEKASNLFGYGIDIHSENAIFINRKLYLLDTYPPKEDWRWGHKHINIYRLATDVYALRGEKEFRELLRGYQDFSKEILDPRYEKFLIIYAASIMVAYYYQLAKHDPSRVKVVKDYHAFLRSYFKTH